MLGSMWDLYFPDQGSNLCPLQWNDKALTTGPPGIFPHCLDNCILYQVLKLGSVSPLTLFSFNTELTILGLLLFYTNFRISLSIPTKQLVRIFIEINNILIFNKIFSSENCKISDLSTIQSKSKCPFLKKWNCLGDT